MSTGSTLSPFDRSIHTYPGAPSQTRIEADSLGSVDVPADAYWGVHTARALTNFAISGRPISEYPDLLVAYAVVKQAAARANAEVGFLDAEKARLIEQACIDVRDGNLHEQFVVDIIQGGAGTSTNMNVNEVIANRGLEIAGREFGDYGFLNPNDDVNRGQSTNDTYPTAFKLALIFAGERLVEEFDRLIAAFSAKGDEFADVVKVGRTQLQDAVPMTVGQEFTGFTTSLRDERNAIAGLVSELTVISLGATAIGTGITADPAYTEVVRRHLSEIVGREFTTATDLIAATSDMGVFLRVSGALRNAAMKLSKICNDLRLLSSGPQFGLGEINLPERQAGSSIMPGKVNPVIPEVVNEVCFAVTAADIAISFAAEAGQLQLNAFEPLMAHKLLQNEKWLTSAMITLRENCVDGITVNRERLASQVDRFVGVVTAFTPYIGYETAATLAKRALKEPTPIADLLTENDLMDPEDVAALLEPARLSGQDASVPALRRDYHQAQPRVTQE